MPSTIIAIGVVTAAIFIWAITAQRRLVVLDENINNAMTQIGVQLSCRIDALIAVLEIIKRYAEYESEALITAVKSSRCDITAKSTPDDVQHLEAVIGEALGKIASLSEQYPLVKTNESYIKTMDAVETYENMLRTSRLIYNDSVNKLNRQIRLFPVSIIAGMLGFSGRNYVEEQVPPLTAFDIKSSLTR